MAVRIGIPVPTSNDAAYNDHCWPDYADAVRDSGGEAVKISPALTAAEMRDIVRSCEGYVLPGSPADVDPRLYGQEREASTADADGKRQELDYFALEHAASTGKPVLAICYGMQIMNVWRGGTLVQDLVPVPVNHAAGSSVAVAHSTLVAGQSLLAGLLTAAEAPQESNFRKLPVNSSHHQAVAIPGEDLVVVARCGQDAVVEAVEGRVGQAAMVGVQWHPERSISISAASRALFSWLALEAEDRLMLLTPGDTIVHPY